MAFLLEILGSAGVMSGAAPPVPSKPSQPRNGRPNILFLVVESTDGRTCAFPLPRANVLGAEVAVAAPPSSHAVRTACGASGRLKARLRPWASRHHHHHRGGQGEDTAGSPQACSVSLGRAACGRWSPGYQNDAIKLPNFRELQARALPRVQQFTTPCAPAKKALCAAPHGTRARH